MDIEITCRTCSQKFNVDESLLRWVHFCQACLNKMEHDRKAERRQAAWEEFKDQCPIAFHRVNRASLPKPEKLDEVLRWAYGPKGLLLHGETGRGKTRCAWALICREAIEFNRAFICMDSMAGMEYAAHYGRGSDIVYDWTRERARTPILLMDDVFKNKFTDSFESTVFTILDQRFQNLKPTIITCNDTGETLAQRMSQDRAKPFLRRLREYCEPIQF